MKVGNSPASMITFTRDCQKIIVANEGEAGKDEHGKFLDPEGSISIIEFGQHDLHQPPKAVRTADFRKFNHRSGADLGGGAPGAPPPHSEP